MGTGWRRAFCTTIPRDREAKVGEKQNHLQNLQTPPSPRPRRCSKLGFMSGGSNPSTPKLQSQHASNPNLRCRSSVQTPPSNDHRLISPKLPCNSTTTNQKCSTKSSTTFLGSNPSSPRSPFSILKNSLRLSRVNNCGVCSQIVKTGQGMAICTAECSHSFHLPCIATHVKKQSSLICPVCKSSWKDVPLLAIQQMRQNHHQDQEKRLETDTHIKKPEEIGQPTPPSVTKFKTKNDQPQLQIKHSDYSRSYNDDEPLLPPVAGARFNPIPEENEDEKVEDEIEEFQGFFVNPISSDDSVMNSRYSRNVKVKLVPEAAVVSVGRTHETYAVVLKVKAPPTSPPQPAARKSGTAHFLDSTRRAAIDLVTVLDVSDSMSGAKLQMLKRAMRLVISSLSSADRLSIVAFSVSPRRLMPLRRMTIQGQRSARRIVDNLVCGQGTSVGEALRKATKVLEGRREKNPVASVMLLSDGHDQTVPTSKANRRQATNVSSTRFSHIEIPVHAFGFGEGAGYEDAFAKCVGGLLSVVVQDLHIQLGVACGSDPVEISAVYSCNGRPTVLSSGSFRLGDLYAEEERELLLELKVPSPVTGPHLVLSVRCSYRDPATQEFVYGREHALLVPRAQTVRSSASKIERLKNYFIATRAVAEARSLVEHSNDLSSAQRLLSSTWVLLMQSSSTISTDVHVGCLEAEMEEVQFQMERQRMIQRRRISEREANVFMDENGEPLTPTSAWRVAERLAKVATMKKSLNRVSDLHGFENARF